MRAPNLRTKIMRLALIPTVLMLLAATVVTYVVYQRMAQQLVRVEYEATAIDAATRMGANLGAFGDILFELAQVEDLRSQNLEEQRLALERWGNRLYPFDAGVAVINQRGIIAWSQPLRFDWIGRDMSQTEFFQQGQAGESHVFSDLMSAEGLLHEDVILIGVPFLDLDGRFAGMLAGAFHINYSQLSPIYAELLRVGLADRGYAYLVDSRGHVIYHPDATRVNMDMFSSPIVQRALQGETGATILIDQGAQDLVVGYAPVPGAGWGLIVQENWRQAMAPVRRFMTSLLGALLVGLAVPALLVYIGVDRITRPVAALAEGAERIAKGDFTHTVNVATHDELQRLAQQFNVMARRLQASYATLEQKVEARTSELAVLNAIAGKISQSLDAATILRDVLSEIAEGLSARSCAVFLCDAEMGEMEVVAKLGFEAGSDLFQRRLEIARDLAARTIELGTSTYEQAIIEEEEGEGTLDYGHEVGWGTMVCLPLRVQKGVEGALFVAAYAYRALALDHERLLIAIGHQLEVGLENARLFAEEQQRRQEAMALADMADLVSGNLDIDQILERAALRISTMLGADRCAVLTQSANEPSVMSVACCDGNGSSIEVMQRLCQSRLLTTDSWPLREAIATRQSVSITDAQGDTRLDSKLASGLGASSILVTPIFVRDQVLGLLYLDKLSSAAPPFDASDRALALALCNQVAIALENARLFQDLERRNSELSTLNAIAATVNQSLVLEETLSNALAKTLDLVGVEVGEIRLWDATSHTLVLRARQGLLQERGIDTGLVLDARLAAILDARRTATFDDVQTLRNERPKQERLVSLAVVPLLAKEHVLGVMSIGSRQVGHRFSERDAELLDAIGIQLGTALENARLFENERLRAHQLGIITEINQHIAAILSLNELLPFVARTLQETFGYFSVNILLLDGEQDHLVLRACAGAYTAHLALGSRIGAGEGFHGRVIDDGRSHVVVDLTEEPLYRGLDRVVGSATGILLPIKVGGRILGVLDVQRQGPRPFGEMELDHLQTLSDQIAIAIENARLYEQSRDLAIVEERTRLARELHDSVTQSLFSIVLNAEAAGTLLEGHPDRAHQPIQRMQEVAQDALAEMRALIYELRPPSLGEQDFESALRRYVDVVSRRYQLDIELRIVGERVVSRELEQALYRIVQEALNNVVKHAQAQQATVELILAEREVRLTVQDDGVGFDERPLNEDRHFGLESMRDRAEALGGIFDITSKRQVGTCVRVSIPLREG